MCCSVARGEASTPAHRTGTELVARLIRALPPKRFLPALYGCNGLVDVSSIEAAARG